RVRHFSRSYPEPAVELENPAIQIVVLEHEGRRGGDLRGLAEPLRRDRGGELREDLGLHAGHHLGLDEPRRDRVRTDAVPRELLRPDDREGRDARLGRGVVALTEIAFARYARDVQN